MSMLRTGATAVTAAACSFGLCQAVSCGTDAVGVDDCREIETARCEAAVHCSGELQVDDVDACKRYYRDHCLHGLGVSDAPGEPILNRCITAIETAGDCAAINPTMTIAECREYDSANRDRLRSGNEDRELATVCDVIQYPERTVECGSFLTEPDLPPEQPEGGAGGAPSSTAGAWNGGASS